MEEDEEGEVFSEGRVRRGWKVKVGRYEEGGGEEERLRRG